MVHLTDDRDESKELLREFWRERVLGYENLGQRRRDLGCVITAFDVQTGIEPESVLCLGKMWRKPFPARDAENGVLRHCKAL